MDRWLSRCPDEEQFAVGGQWRCSEQLANCIERQRDDPFQNELWSSLRGDEKDHEQDGPQNRLRA